MPRDRRGAGELMLLARRGSGHPPSDLDRPCRLATSDRLDGRCLPSGVRGTPLDLPAFPPVFVRVDLHSVSKRIAVRPNVSESSAGEALESTVPVDNSFSELVRS